MNSVIKNQFLTLGGGALLVAASFLALPAKAQEESEPVAASAESPASKSDKKEEDEDENIIRMPPPVPAQKRTFTDSEIRQQSAKYEGRFIAYYSDVYKVEKCKRRPVIANETVFKLMRSGAQIAEVPALAIAAIPEGSSIDLGTAESTARPCSSFQGQYVTYSHSDVYYVEKCSRMLIPDYETYVVHRKLKGHNQSSEIMAINWAEFSALKVGKEIESILVKEYAKLLEMGPPVDVIPIDEACAGLNGKMVSFYSRMYRIEKCRKREVDPELYLRKHANVATLELKPEQWISIPDGAPLDGPVSQGKVEQFDPGAAK